MITAWRTDDAAFASSDAIVPWWSVTKTITAVACLRLAEQGKLDLDARLQGRAFCVADLLAHRAGVPSYTEWPDYHEATEQGDAAWPDMVVLDRADGLGPKFDVGERFAYSNTGYLIVRALLEKLFGQPIDRVLQSLVFDPLDMHSAKIARDVDDLAECRWLDGVGYDPKWVYHGLAVGSAADACMFMHMVRSGQFLTEASLSRMRSGIVLGGAIEGRPWESAAYGLGNMCGDMAGYGPVFGHSGNGPQSVAAVYSIEAATGLFTAAAFSDDDREDRVEWRVLEMAREHT